MTEATDLVHAVAALGAVLGRTTFPLPAPSAVASVSEAVDRVFHHALGRPPSAGERSVAEAALRDPSRGTRPSAEGLADLLWAVTMKPEFQLIY